MSNQIPIDADPLAIKPIIEALIFASDEPISPRGLIKLLAGENARPSDRVPPLLKMIEEVASSTDDDPEEVGPSEVEDDPVSEPDVDAPPVETPGLPDPDEEPMESPTIDEPPDEQPPAGTPTIDEPVLPEQPDVDEVADQVIDHNRQGGISLVVEEGESGDEQSNGVADLVEALEGTSRRAARQGSAADTDALDQRYIRRIVDLLNSEYEESNRAFRIVEVAGGFQFATMREYGEYVALLSKEKSRRRLSAAALETLAIIAYRQPVSKPEIEAIRGVNCDQVLLNLMEKNLVVITGRSEAVGRPLLYGTTEDFLRSFGLNNLSDLPKLREIEELMETDALSAESTEVVMIDQETEVEEIEARVGAIGHHREESEEEPEETAAQAVPEPDEAIHQREQNDHEETSATEAIS